MREVRHTLSGSHVTAVPAYQWAIHIAYEAVLRAYPTLPQVVYSKRTLIGLSHGMEAQAAEAAHCPLIFSTFQAGRFLTPEVDRYRRIARGAALVAVFARGASRRIAPERDGMLPVDLAPDDPLCREWHVVVYAENFAALLLCREVEDPATSVDRQRYVGDRDRRFQGVWTFEPAVVQFAAELFLERVRFGAALHDVGKIGVPEAVLLKPGPLDDAELRLMRAHPAIGARIVSDVAVLSAAALAVRHHHERWDGGGYPDGLAGDGRRPHPRHRARRRNR